MDASRQDVAERLGQWLNVAEAIELHAVPGTLAAAEAAAASAAARRPARGVPAPVREPLQQELARVRAVLTRSIQARDPSHRPDPNDPDTEFALYLQRLNEQQRRMEMSVDALRQHVRQQLARTTPALAQLAAMDASMERLFAGREQRLLNTLPVFLKSRFVALREAAASHEAADTPDWLQVFAAEFEQTLLAELELRLLPVVGLIESSEP